MNVVHETNPGLDPDKQVNEDSCAHALVPWGHLLVVCDGMGGHLSGREASTLAVGTIVRFLEQSAIGTPPGLALKAAIEQAGREVFALGGAAHHRLRPGSTCVSVLVHAAGVEVAHVGDSRGYLIRGGEIYPLTRDHSMVRQMVDAGVLSAEEAMRHPDANKITRALGMMPEVEVELRPSPLPHGVGDVLLLSSDGLSDLVAPHEMLGVVAQARASGVGLAGACGQLVALANSRGGHDNITVMLGEVVESAMPAPGRPTIPEAVALDAIPRPMATVPQMAAVVPGALGAAVVAPTISEPQPVGPAPTIADPDTSSARARTRVEEPAAGAMVAPAHVQPAVYGPPPGLAGGPAPSSAAAGWPASGMMAPRPAPVGAMVAPRPRPPLAILVLAGIGAFALLAGLSVLGWWLVAGAHGAGAAADAGADAPVIADAEPASSAGKGPVVPASSADAASPEPAKGGKAKTDSSAPIPPGVAPPGAPPSPIRGKHKPAP
jgi:serine/threonine protein phosphatase PrpC